MPTNCSAYGCSNTSTKESCKKRGISFHKFPLADKILLYRWLLNIKRANFKPTPYSHLCSDHFVDDDFEYQPFTKRRGLKKGAVPTRFSFDSRKKIRRKKQSISRKEEDSETEPVLSDCDMESNEIQKDNPALVDISMNEKFYSPEQLKALTNYKIKKSNNVPNERMVALKESLKAKIILRTLKKQLLDAELKAANAKKDYYEAKIAMLDRIRNDSDSDESSDSDADLPVQNIKTKLKEERISAQIEESVLQKQLKEAKMHASNYEKKYYAAKSSSYTLLH